MNEKEKKLAIKIKNAIDQVWRDYYAEEDIKSGDITPKEVVWYGDCIHNIAEIIYRVGESNRDKKVFEITIEEHISGVFKVEADSIEEAMKIAEDKYKKGVFVVEPDGYPTAKLMIVEDLTTGEVTEWTEF